MASHIIALGSEINITYNITEKCYMYYSENCFLRFSLWLALQTLFSFWTFLWLGLEPLGDGLQKLRCNIHWPFSPHLRSQNDMEMYLRGLQISGIILLASDIL